MAPTTTSGALADGGAEEGARKVRDVLGGAQGAERRGVLANAAGGIVVGGKARDLREGAELARESIDGGRALDKLNGLAEVSQRLGTEE